MSMRGGCAAAGVVAVLALTACAQRSVQPEVPAVLTSPTDQSRAELRRVVSEAMNGVPVTLADDALTADGTLTVGRAANRDTKDMNLGGRETGRPEQFRLVTNGSQCLLVQVRTGRRWVLTAATCTPR